MNRGEVNYSVDKRKNYDDKSSAFYRFYCGDVDAPRTEEVDDANAYHARDLAIQCRSLYKALGLTPVLETRLIHLADSVGVTFPKAPLHALYLRSVDPDWWGRKLARVDQRRYEAGQISHGHVRRGCQLYVSDATLLRIQQKRYNFREASQTLFLVSDDGSVLPMDQAVDAGLANPKNRFADMITRLKGMEVSAKQASHQAVFLTLTCPSRYHASSDCYDGSTPSDAQHYLTTLWARARAALKRAGINPYGFRIAEPHHDACPHWHILLWTRPMESDQLLQIMRRYALHDSPNEPGAQRHRFTVEYIDPKRGSAVGYLVKYLTKNLDGKSITGNSIGQAHDTNGEDLGDSVLAAERVQAWASCWGIRQFQQIGGVPVGPYRELRRVRDVLEDSPKLEALRQAADLGQWADYQVLAQAYRPVLGKCCDALEALQQGDEARAHKLLGRYGEPILRVNAVLSGPERVVTRAARWVICTVDEIVSNASASGAGVWQIALDAIRDILQQREGVAASKKTTPTFFQKQINSFVEKISEDRGAKRPLGLV
jgi:hypothetical protein